MIRNRFLALVAVAVVPALLVGCGDDDNSGPLSIAPAAVTDLAAGNPTAGGVELTWTAPDDADSTGAATEYDIRFSTLAITEENWAFASQALGEPPPKSPGDAETFVLIGLQCDQPYHFALRARDHVEGNWSALSNPTSATTGSCGAIDGMSLLPAGTFTMGSPGGTSAEIGRDGDEPQHQVTLSRSFYLMDHEVTQGEWVALMGTNPSFFTGDGNRPVEQVSWYEAIDYCNARSVHEQLDSAYVVVGSEVTWNPNANGYRLPTEAEWEYACRAGTSSAFSSGGITHTNCDSANVNLDMVGWYCWNAGDVTHVVKGKSPNAKGLHDMHGNVSEWCWDYYASYLGTTTDPSGPTRGSNRVIRGGGLNSGPGNCRSASRNSPFPDDRYNNVGFRLARTSS